MLVTSLQRTDLYKGQITIGFTSMDTYIPELGGSPVDAVLALLRPMHLICRGLESSRPPPPPAWEWDTPVPDGSCMFLWLLSELMEPVDTATEDDLVPAAAAEDLEEVEEEEEEEWELVMALIGGMGVALLEGGTTGSSSSTS